MRITDLLKLDGIALDVKPVDKNDALAKLADLMDKSGNLADKDTYLKAVLAREATGTTGLGDGIATPHAKSSAVKAAGLSAMVVKDGVAFDSLDGQPARLFFMIAAPDSANDLHIEVLSRLATLIMDSDFKEALIAASTKEEFLRLIDEKESAQAEKAAEAPVSGSYRLLAVTACPTGIAHTFMAAESLEATAK